jgi:predicted transcriptional regulator
MRHNIESMTDVRRRVRDHVRANPGVHFNALARNLDIATGQAQYHLHRLGRRDDVVAERIRGRTHYFVPEYDAWERRTLALYRRETDRDLVTLLLDEGRLPAATLADRLGLARSTVSWHLDSLSDAGVVETSRGARGRIEVSLARPAETDRLRREVAPSFAGRAAPADDGGYGVADADD